MEKGGGNKNKEAIGVGKTQDPRMRISFVVEAYMLKTLSEFKRVAPEMCILNDNLGRSNEKAVCFTAQKLMIKI